MVKKGHTQEKELNRAKASDSGSESSTGPPPAKQTRLDEHMQPDAATSADNVPTDRIGGVATPTGIDASQSVNFEGMMQFMRENFASINTGLSNQGGHIENLTQTMGDIQANFGRFQTETRNEMLRLEEKIRTQNAKFQEQVEALQKDFRNLAATPQSSIWPPAIASQSAASGNQPASSAAASATRSSPPSSRAAPPSRTRSAPPSDATHICKVLALGFPRELPRAAHLGHFQTLSTKVPDTMLDNVECHAGNAKAHTLIFHNVGQMRRFLGWAREEKNILKWTDPRSKNDHPIHYKELKTEAEKQCGRRLAPFYDHLDKAMKHDQDNAIFPAGSTLTADTRKGRLFLKTPDDMWIFIRTDDAGNFIVDRDAYTHFQLQLDAVDAMISKASQE
jgi:hypothetical protein